MIPSVLGAMSVLLISISDIGYIRVIWRKGAKPHRFTWFIFTVTALIIFGSQWQLGATASLLVFGWFAVINAAIFGLSLLPGRGEGGFDKPNTVAALLAGLSLVLWFGVDTSAALMCILAADTIAICLTVGKVWKDHMSEPRMMWGLGSVGALLSVFAVGDWDMWLLLAPLHLVACDVSVFATILIKSRMAKAIPPPLTPARA